MSQGVFTPELRFKWVKGQVTSGEPDEGFVACGDGTIFPMLVTRDQLAEIMYRVRDHEITSSLAFDGNPVLVNGTPPVKLVEYHENLTMDYFPEPATHRGYYRTSAGLHVDPIPAWVIPYYGDEYDPPANDSTLRFRDAEDERAIWTSPLVIDHFASGAVGGREVRTGFSFYTSRTDEYTPGDIDFLSYCLYQDDSPSYPLVTCEIAFGDRVAWIDDDGSGNPFSSGNRLFLEFYGQVSEDLLFYAATSDAYFNGLGASTGSFLILSMASGQATARFYCDSSTTGNFTLTATKWWPYAQDSPAVPVWNAETGARL